MAEESVFSDEVTPATAEERVAPDEASVAAQNDSRGFEWTAQQIGDATEVILDFLKSERNAQMDWAFVEGAIATWIERLQGDGRNILNRLGRPWGTREDSRRTPERVAARWQALEAAEAGRIVKVLSLVGQEYDDMFDRFKGADLLDLRVNVDGVFCDFVWGEQSLWDKFVRSGYPPRQGEISTILRALARL